MVRHNNVIPGQHFHKNWANRVKTWLHQPAQKRIRRDKRKLKAASIAPRPSSGQIRPLVHCPTQKYNAKVRFGRGFSLSELKEAGINKHWAKTVGISVDHRRTNKSEGVLQANVERLHKYKARLVIFDKKQDATKELLSTKSGQDLYTVPKTSESAHSFTEITEEMKDFKAFATLRQALADTKLLGIRIKKASAGKEEKAAPAAKGDEE